MGRVRTEKTVIDLTSGSDEEFGIYATDDGFIEIVVSKAGVKHVASFTPEEWARIAVGGIELGVIARAARDNKKLLTPPLQIPPEIAATLTKANGS